MRAISECRLYGIVDLGYVARERIWEMTALMLKGGVDIVQLRAKNSTEADIEEMAAELLPLTKAEGAPFIINDFPEIALRVGADGVHVGQDDRSVWDARNVLGPDKIVGKSTHSLDQARAAAKEPVDYIGFGPLFATPTKPEYVPIGLEDIATVHRDVSLPIFCIGGIKWENAWRVLEAGASRLVIVSGILTAGDVVDYCCAVRETMAEMD